MTPQEQEMLDRLYKQAVHDYLERINVFSSDCWEYYNPHDY